MKIAMVGCGYVSDHYMETLAAHPELELLGVADRDMERARSLAGCYGVKAYASTQEALADPAVELIVNLTDPRGHYEVSRASLLAGKHVYSEKPLAVRFSEARELVDLAKRQGLLISSAPCSALGGTAQTLWRAVLDGAVGRVRLVYAELDDNPVYLMRPEGWTNARGIPWPYLNEYENGCTLEHAGYYLTWLCAMFGPAESVTGFSACLVPDKTPLPLDPPDTPDFSAACIVFRSGVVARLTCSIVAPYDHRIRIIGTEGVLSADECWNYSAPVHLERFSQVSLNARRARSTRASSALQSLFGVGGRRLDLVGELPPRCQVQLRTIARPRRSLARKLIGAVKRRERIWMDFLRGVAEMAAAVEAGRDCLLSPDFVLHVNEITLAMQNAGSAGSPYRLTTRFEPRMPMAATLQAERDYGRGQGGLFLSIVEDLIARLHRH